MQGIINYYNGVDIDQTQDYIKISVESYLKRVFERHGWTEASHKPSTTKNIPLSSDSKIIEELEQTKGPETDGEKKKLELDMGFSYRAAIGELIYAMVTCRPDISFATTKLSQYLVCPA